MSDQPTLKSRLLNPLCIATLLAIVALSYGGVLHFDFLFDDEFLIQKNMFLRHWSSFVDIITHCSTAGFGGLDSFYRPVQGVLYLIVYQIAGLNPVGFHLLNLGFHFANAVLLFGIARRLELTPRWSLICAALWVAHPVHTEAVTYMSATADSTYAFFCLFGVWILLGGQSWMRVLTACLIFVLGLASKESAIVFPALALAAVCRVRRQPLNVSTLKPTLPFWFIAGLYLIARKTVLDFQNGQGFYKDPNIYSEHILYRLYTFCATLPSYLKVFFWPNELFMERPFPVYTEPTFLPVAIGIALLAIALWALWRFFFRNPNSTALFGVAWMCMAHAPHTGVVVPVNSLFLEHWLYLPSVGLLLALTAGLQDLINAWPARLQLHRRTIAASLTLSLIVALLASKTYAQNQVWSGPIRFYNHLIDHGVTSARIDNNLAMAYSDIGQDELAMTYYRRAIELSDVYAQTRYNLALLLVKTGKIDEAIANLKRAIEINRDFYYAYGTLAEIYKAQGHTADAEAYARQYGEIKSRFVH